MMAPSHLFGSKERSSSQPGMPNLLRRGLALVLAYLMVPIGIGDVYAQSYGQQYNPQYNQQYGPQGNPQYGQPYGQPGYYQPLSPGQLDQLVAPVALYPDSLVAQVLAASTYPNEVEDADRWMHSYEGYGPQQVAQMANGMPWDPSVKSLTAFPSVLDNMAQNLDWTTQLGNAYYNQPQDVMEAVQAMRQQAYDAGYLRSTPQMYVDYSPQYISIVPANPSVVYVPYYDPWNVYGPVIHPWYQYYAPRPPRGAYYGGVAISFGFGISVVAFRHFGWGWGHWDPDWRRREVYYHHNRFVSRSRTVFNRGHFGGFDRHYARTDFRRNNNGRGHGYNRQDQFRGRQNPNFQRAPEYRQLQNGRQQNLHRPQQNFHPRQPFQNRQQQNNRQRQNLNRQRTQQFRNQRNIHHAPQGPHRTPQQFRGYPQQNFNRSQRQHNVQQSFHSRLRSTNRSQHFHGRPQQNFHPPQQRSRQNFNRGQRPQNHGQQFHGRSNNRPHHNSRAANHPHGQPDRHGNGHGHGRR